MSVVDPEENRLNGGSSKLKDFLGGKIWLKMEYTEITPVINYNVTYVIRQLFNKDMIRDELEKFRS